MKYKIIGYPTFLFVCIVLALFYRFPAPQIQDRINENLGRKNTDISLDFTRLAPYPPAALKAKNIILNWQGTPILHGENARVGIKLLSLFKAHRTMPFQANLLGGNISGQADFDRKAMGT